MPSKTKTLGQKTFPTRNELHILRKLWHALGGIAIVYAYAFMNFSDFGFTLFIGSLWLVFCAYEVARKYSPAFNAMAVKVMGPLLRRHELNGLSGTFYYLLGCFFAVLFYSKIIALLCILYLSIGDPIASFFGILFRSVTALRFPRKGGAKNLIGTFVAMLLCAAITFSMIRTYGRVDKEFAFKVSQYPAESLSSAFLFISAVGGIAAGVTELVCPNPIPTDDNMVIPVFSGLALCAAFKLVGL